jgi:Uma2 family endonuclease
MPAFRRQWTVDDLQDLPDDGQRYEVIDGELFVTPSPSARHQRALGLLHRRVADYLDREPVGYVFVAPGVGGRSPESFADVKQLLLAVEVLSPNTARADRVVKRALYRDERVPEFWIVDLDSRTFERSTPADPRVEMPEDRIEWTPEGASSPLVIDVAAYFAEVLDA